MDESGLVTSYLLNGSGGGRIMAWDDIRTWQPDHGVLWLHLNRASEDIQNWMQTESRLSPLVAEALLAENTRPRCVQLEKGVMLFLRGINQNPGADPEDMVSIRCWIEQDRIITVRMRRLLSIDDLSQAIDQGNGPATVGDFVVQLAGHLIARMANLITTIDDRVDQLQDQVLEDDNTRLSNDLREIRREIIALRRYLAPQREALTRLTQLRIDWLDEGHQMRLREEADRVTRFVEDLDSARERAAVTQEELSNRLSEQLNKRMYVLSVVAAIFLPLGFLTGLFGINVGGIPLADNPAGFADVVLLLTAVTVVQILIFRWRKWF